MTVTSPAPTSPVPGATGSPLAPTPATWRLLAAGAVAGPLWAAVSFAQAATRADYTFTREPLSMLATGPLGWVQTTNFLVAGALMVLGAVGLRRVRPADPAPARAAAVAGLLLAAAGVLAMDPAGPAGAAPAAPSRHAIGHMAVGTGCFAALTVLVLLWAARFRRAGRPVAAGVSVLAGVGVVAGNAWAMTGGAWGSVTIAVGVVAAMLWSSRVHAGLRAA